MANDWQHAVVHWGAHDAWHVPPQFPPKEGAGCCIDCCRLGWYTICGCCIGWSNGGGATGGGGGDCGGTRYVVDIIWVDGCCCIRGLLGLALQHCGKHAGAHMLLQLPVHVLGVS